MMMLALLEYAHPNAYYYTHACVLAQHSLQKRVAVAESVISLAYREKDAVVSQS